VGAPFAGGAAVTVADHRVRTAIVFLKVLSFFGCLLMAFGLTRLARANGYREADALAVALLNPITLIHLVGGAHNEALMVALLVLGLGLAAEARPLLGIACCIVAGAVKTPALAGAVFIMWHWIVQPVPAALRFRRVVSSSVVAAVSFTIAVLPTQTPWRWLSLASTPTHVQSYLSPSTITGLGVDRLLSPLGVTGDNFLSAWQLLFVVAGLGISLLCLLRVRRLGVARALGLSLLAVALLSPVLFPFYLMWGLAPLAGAGLRRERMTLIALSVVLTPALLPGGRAVLDAIVALGPLWLGGAIAVLLILSIPTKVPRLSTAT